VNPTVTTTLIEGTIDLISAALETVNVYGDTPAAVTVRGRLEIAQANQRALLAELDGPGSEDEGNAGPLHGMLAQPLKPLPQVEMSNTDIRLSIAMALIEKGYLSGVITVELPIIFEAVKGNDKQAQAPDPF